MRMRTQTHVERRDPGGREHVPDARGASEMAPAQLQATPPPSSVSPSSSHGDPASMGWCRGRGKLCLQNPREVAGAMPETCFFLAEPEASPLDLTLVGESRFIPRSPLSFRC